MMNNIYPDIWAQVYQHLEAWDISIASQVCKNMYRGAVQHNVATRISFPFKKGYKLTHEQFETLRAMLKSNSENKAVSGEVGSGKTWLAFAYAMYKYRDLIGEDFKILIVAPPANVYHWEQFIKTYTDLEFGSNHSSSGNYCKTDAELMKYDIHVTSLIKSQNIGVCYKHHETSFVLLHDESHHGICMDTNLATEYVRFSAEKIYSSKDCDNFTLNSTVLRSDLPPIEVLTYSGLGISDEILEEVWGHLGGHYDLSIRYKTQREIMLLFAYGRSIRCDIVHKVGKKKFRYNWPFGANEINIEQLCENMMKVPKMRALLSLCAKVYQKGEKIIVFDTDAKYIDLVYMFLTYKGLKCYVFSKLYSPKQRVRQIEKFSEDGTVLIGSINMLGEGHNIASANHVTFIRAPWLPSLYKQAIGRVHRFPQNKEVFIHMLFCNALEQAMFEVSTVDMGTELKFHLHREEIEEVKNLCKTKLTHAILFHT